VVVVVVEVGDARSGVVEIMVVGAVRLPIP